MFEDFKAFLLTGIVCITGFWDRNISIKTSFHSTKEKKKDHFSEKKSAQSKPVML